MIQLKSLICLVLLFFAYSAKSQTSTIKVWVYDNYGNSDTIEIGLNSNSTVGFDTLIGEIDYSGVVYDSLEIISIQRDSFNHECLSLGASMSGPVYFQQNRDIKKIDFRPYIGNNGITNNSFELLIHSKSYPIFMFIDASNIGFMNHNVLNVFREPDCNTNTVVGTLSSNDSYGAMGIAYIPDSTTKYNLFIWESFDFNGYIVNTTEPLFPSKEIKIIPNPFSTNFKIESNFSSSAYKLVLYNLVGKEILTKEYEKNQLINLEYLESGVYILKMIDRANQVTICQKVIKS